MRPLIGYTAGEMARRAFIEACDREDDEQTAQFEAMRDLLQSPPREVSWIFKPDFELDS